MRHPCPHALALTTLLFGAAPTIPVAAQTVTVRVDNPTDVPRPDEVVALAWADLRNRNTNVATGNVRVLDASGAETLSQPIDFDADGSIDELLFIASLGPDESRNYTIEAAPATVTAPRVFVMHDDYRDDMAWESDRMAYRTYGQGLWNVPEFDPLVSSGIDVWLKRVPDLIIERWYEKGAEAYHMDTGEGADFYAVGATLGNGGTAIWADDSLHRAQNFAGHRIIANGPIRAIFEMEYDPWQAGDVEVSEVKRITVDAGQHLFKSESTFTVHDAGAATPGSARELIAAVGLVKRPGVVGSTKQANDGWAWLSTWGPVDRGAGGHGDLGGATLVDREHLVAMRETVDHYLALLTAAPGGTVTQYVGAGWTASGDFESVQDWWAHADTFAQRLQAPLRVSVLPASR
jgi:pectinesterase